MRKGIAMLVMGGGVINALEAMDSFHEDIQLAKQPLEIEMFLEKVFSGQDYLTVADYMSQYNNIANSNKGGMGVHDFNRLMNWKEKLPHLITIDAACLQSDFEKPMDFIALELYNSGPYQQLTPQRQQDVQRNFNQLKVHSLVAPVEAVETGAHVPQLLSRCWSLVNFPGMRNEKNIFVFQDNAIDFLMNVLVENSDTGGGCYPGHAGRLCQFYLLLINSCMEG